MSSKKKDDHESTQHLKEALIRKQFPDLMFLLNRRKISFPVFINFIIRMYALDINISTYSTKEILLKFHKLANEGRLIPQYSNREAITILSEVQKPKKKKPKKKKPIPDPKEPTPVYSKTAFPIMRDWLKSIGISVKYPQQAVAVIEQKALYYNNITDHSLWLQQERILWCARWVQWFTGESKYRPKDERPKSRYVTLEYAKQSRDFLHSPEWTVLRDQVLREEGSTCQKCGISSQYVRMTVDHILPRRYFPHLALKRENLQVYCRRCNSRKGNKLDWDLIHKRGLSKYT